MQPYYDNNGIRIFLGRCEDILPELPDSCCSLVLTDPPFGINYRNNMTGREHDRIAGDATTFSYKLVSQEVYRLLQEPGAFFAYTCWSSYAQNYLDVVEAGFAVQEPLIVQKRPSGKTNLYGTFQSNADWILFAHKGKFKFYETFLARNKGWGRIPYKKRAPVPEWKARFPSCWFGTEYPWSTENPSSVKHLRHPTIKSAELMQWIILMASEPGDTVIDPYMGSGSTLLGAAYSSRKGIGIEVDERYCEMAALRLSKGI